MRVHSATSRTSHRPVPPRRIGAAVIDRLEGRTLMSALRPDDAFADGGTALVDVFGRLDAARVITVAADGKILVGGFSAHPETDNHGIIARFNPDGSRDATFGDDGVLVAAPFDYVDGLLVTPDGRILVGGSATVDDLLAGIVAGGGTSTAALARYNDDGSLDTSFGSGGTGFTGVEMSAWNDTFHKLAFAPDGKIVALSTANFVGGFDQGDFGVARFNPDGTLDATFGGGDGVVTTDFSDAPHSEDHAYAIAFTTDGKLVVGGSTSDHGGDNLDPRDGGFALARYSDDGSLDATFGAAGKVFTPFDYGDSPSWVTWGGGTVNSLQTTADGKLLAVGKSTMGDLTLARYNADGSLDASFADAGFKYHGFDTATDLAWAVAPGGDGNLLVATAGSTLTAVAVDPDDGRLVGEVATRTLNDQEPQSLLCAFTSDGQLLVAGHDAATAPPLGGGIDWMHTADLALTRYTTAPAEPSGPPFPVDPTPPEPGEPIPTPAPQDGADTDEGVVAPRTADETAGSDLDVTIVGRQVVRGGKVYKFKAVFNADEPIDVESVRRVGVSGPNQFHEVVEATRLKASRDGTRVTASYRVAAPGGSFDSGDNGAYTIDQARVFTSENPPAETNIDRSSLAQFGTFQVDSRRPARLTLPEEAALHASPASAAELLDASR